MVEQLERIDPRIIYVSLLIIVALAIASNLATERTLSILSGFLIVIIALGNIGYLYRKVKKRVK
jgi:hypothetical protein